MRTNTKNSIITSLTYLSLYGAFTYTFGTTMIDHISYARIDFGFLLPVISSAIFLYFQLRKAYEKFNRISFIKFMGHITLANIKSTTISLPYMAFLSVYYYHKIFTMDWSILNAIKAIFVFIIVALIFVLLAAIPGAFSWIISGAILKASNNSLQPTPASGRG